jgi:hypothetical protein
MNNKLKGIATTIALITLLLAQGIKAQDIDIGVFTGGSYYLGELNPGRQFFFTRPAFGGLMRFNINNRFAIRGQLVRGEVAGDDLVSKANELRNLRFTSPVSELSATLEFNFLEYMSGSHVNYFSPFLFVGPAFFSFNPQTQFKGQTISLRDIGTEGQIEESKYNLFAFALVFGFGFRYSLSNRLGFSLEWGMRKTTTDYIDDVSGNYHVDFSQLEANQIRMRDILSDPAPIKHQPGMQRGNPQNNDWYSFAGITLTYRFTIGESSTCVHFTR